MPELPEMENYRKLLEERIGGKNIQFTAINREKSVNVPVQTFITQIQHKTVLSIERRAKHLIFHLDSGMKLLLHLMLGGWMYFGNNENDSPNRTKQITFHFDNGTLYFIGLRLGYLHLLTEEQLENTLKNLGPEPLPQSLSEAKFLSLIEKKKGMLKTTLINQSFLSGIGNFYSDEICFEAKVKPMKKANELTKEQKITLYHAIIKVLQRGINQGGYMENPVYNGDNRTGKVQAFVYDREGQVCTRCNHQINKSIISSKKTFYCSNCQS